MAREQLSWIDALSFPHSTPEGGEAILARLQHLAEGGAAQAGTGGTAKRYDEHGRLISETYEEFAAWAIAAGLMSRAELAA